MLFLVFLLFYLAPETLPRAIPQLSNLFSAGLTEGTSTVTYPPNDRSALLLAISRDVSTCTCPPHQRSVWDIVWSCLATIFACAWVSVHPNIPSPDEKWWRKSLRRVEYLMWTLLTPELIVWWAARQWMGARKIQKGQEDRGWTLTHGHFMQMGGFMLFRGETKLGTLSYPFFCELLDKGRIQFPDITQEEIEDRSKSDGLSKALVIAQTGWFVIQCVARRVRSLPLTELELLTLALAALNGVIYFFWWNKPFDVQCPVPVHLLLPTESYVGIPLPTSNLESINHKVSTMHDDMSIDETTDPEICRPEPTSNQEMPSTSKDPLLPAGSQRKTPQFDQIYTSFLNWSRWKKVITWPWTFGLFAGEQLLELIGSENAHVFDQAHRDMKDPYDIDTPGLMHVPTFYSLDGASINDAITVSVIPLIGSLFGAIHCAGWAFQFPTDLELWLWRISSLIITIVPLSLPLNYAYEQLREILDEVEWPWLVRAPWPWLARTARTAGTWLGRAEEPLLFYIAMAVVVPSLPLYILGRLILMAEAIYALRDLPPGAFDLVQWTSFLPHI